MNQCFVMLRKIHIFVGNVWYFSNYHVFLPIARPQTDESSCWFIDEGPACTTKRLPLLTPTVTVSSDWNLGINWSPRTISDWLRGRKRHSTFMLHSAGTSAIAQIEGGGGRMLLFCWEEMMLLLLGLIGAWSDRQNKRPGMRSGVVLLRGEDSGDGGEV